jgi:hypothetical protein
MILNTEPGGWGADTARPAVASSAPSRGRTTAMPPSRSPSAAFAARESRTSMVVRTGRARIARVRATTRSPKNSRAAGWPVSRSAYLRSRPSLSALSGSGEPSAASTEAERGSRPARCTTASSARRPGRRSEKFQSTPASPPLPDTGTSSVPRSVPKASVRMATGTGTRPSRSGPMRPIRTSRTPAARSALR